MRLCLISDTHNRPPDFSLMPEADVLIHAGDATNGGKSSEIRRHAEWLREVSSLYRHVIIIAGNHDRSLQSDHPAYPFQRPKLNIPGVTYLCDSACEIDGVVFYGSPWIPWDNHESCGRGFKLHRASADLAALRRQIPDATNVLITHAPPFGVLDEYQGEHLGCAALRQRVAELPHLRAHIFGHVHTHGQRICGNTRSHIAINAAWWNDAHSATNAARPLVVEI